jgi:hypothetical protein
MFSSSSCPLPSGLKQTYLDPDFAPVNSGCHQRKLKCPDVRRLLGLARTMWFKAELGGSGVAIVCLGRATCHMPNLPFLTLGGTVSPSEPAAHLGRSLRDHMGILSESAARWGLAM